MLLTYSFPSVSANITGTNGAFSLSDGNAEGGITVAMAGDKNSQQVGAAGEVMNVLHAANNGTITARFLKTSSTNAMLQTMYDADRADPSAWGGNQIKIRNVDTGDDITATGVAFKKFPDNVYDTAGPALEWTLDCATIDTILGGN